MTGHKRSVWLSVKNRVVTIYAVKMKNYFKKKYLSSRRTFLQKYFAQKIQDKTPKHPVFLTKSNV